MTVIPHTAAAARRPEAPRLLEQMRRAIRVRHDSLRTEEALARLEGTVQLVVLLLYGTGMRILECLRLGSRTSNSTSATSRSATPRAARTAPPSCPTPVSAASKTTTIDTQILNRPGGRGIIIPADTLQRIGPSTLPAHPGEVRL